MNGAQTLLRTLVDCDVDVCFGNPGTSEMHFVAALDEVSRMRCVLGLFEGVVTGAADGYGRMTGRPAATLLHLGPGLANGLANLHNARRAGTPVLNVVGDHALTHKQYDAPLETDIDAAAGTVSGWVRRPHDTATVGAEAAAGVAAATGPPGGVATLILPADVSWSEGGEVAAPHASAARRGVPEQHAAEVAAALRSGGPKSTVLLGGPACGEHGLLAAARIRAATGARVLVETFPPRLPRGAGLPAFDALEYLPELAADQLADTADLVLAGARPPVSFFAYPDRPSRLQPDDARVHTLAEGADDVEAALAAVADHLAVGNGTGTATGDGSLLQQPARPALPTGALTPRTCADVVGALLPEDAVVVDEAVTLGAPIAAATAGAPRHDWLKATTGGAIGNGLPLAVGAGMACPDRPVVCLEADGSAMYTISALWTMAREGLDVTTVLLNNHSYAILRGELQRVGAEQGGSASAALLDLDNPDLDFVATARGMGVPAARASTAEELAQRLRAALAEPGPHLVEAVLPAP
jgi:acetolactate synthase I/II/III large subunit